MNKNDGGPAFPLAPEWVLNPGKRTLVPGDEAKGMTLRDWFAGHALIALVAKAPLFDRDGEHGPKFDVVALHQFRQDMAESAYDYADAMIAQRWKS